MSAVLNNVEVPDAYSAAGTLHCPNAARIRLQLANQAVYWQRGFRPPGGQGVRWEDEEFLIPSTYSLNEPCDAIRFRAAVPAAELEEGEEQARVTVATRTEQELQGKPS